MNATPASASLGLGLVIVKVSDVLPLVRIGLAPKAFTMDGGSTAVSEATAEPVAVELVPLSAEETAGYVKHRMRVAGATAEVFTPSALRS